MPVSPLNTEAPGSSTQLVERVPLMRNAGTFRRAFVVIPFVCVERDAFPLGEVVGDVRHIRVVPEGTAEPLH